MSVKHRAIIGCVVAVLVAGAFISMPSAAPQSACPSSLSPPNSAKSSYPAVGMRFDITIEASAGCEWTAVSDAPYINLLTNPNGTGNGTIGVDVADNNGNFRFGSVKITFRSATGSIDLPVLISQNGCLSVLSSPPYADLDPGYARRQYIDASGGRRYVRVNPTTAGCVWDGQSHAPWITAGAGSSGAGAGIFYYEVAPNPSGSARTGTFRVGYLTFTVIQGAPTYSDLSGDGFPDLVWHHRTTGEVAAWFMRGLELLEGRLLEPGQVEDTGWKVVGSGDFSSDGGTDLLWQHEDGRVAVWTMTGTLQTSGQPLTSAWAPPDADWRVRAIADLNSDGRPDIIWRHRTTGQIGAWLMYGRASLFDVTFAPSSVPDTNWEIVGAADFNGDAQADLLWQNQATGHLAVWTLEWATGFPQTLWKQVRGLALIPGQVADTNWKVRGVSDIDRDGHPDIIWQNQANGLISTWLMDGITMREGVLLGPGQVADTDWVIVGPR